MMGWWENGKRNGIDKKKEEECEVCSNVFGFVIVDWWIVVNKKTYYFIITSNVQVGIVWIVILLKKNWLFYDYQIIFKFH